MNSTPRPFVAVARDLAPILGEFLAHPDCPPSLYNALVEGIGELESHVSLSEKIGFSLAWWCERATAEDNDNEEHA